MQFKEQDIAAGIIEDDNLQQTLLEEEDFSSVDENAAIYIALKWP